jgi:hypothetical protein
VAWLLFFFGGLLTTFACVEIDCSGTLALIGGDATCNDFHPEITAILTSGAAMVTLVVWPNALRLRITERFGRPMVRASRPSSATPARCPARATRP